MAHCIQQARAETLKRIAARKLLEASCGMCLRSWISRRAGTRQNFA